MTVSEYSVATAPGGDSEVFTKSGSTFTPASARGYTLTEGGANYGIGLALAATLNSFKNRNTSSPVRIDEDTMDAYLAVSEGFDSMGLGLAAML